MLDKPVPGTDAGYVCWLWKVGDGFECFCRGADSVLFYPETNEFKLPLAPRELFGVLDDSL